MDRNLRRLRTHSYRLCLSFCLHDQLKPVEWETSWLFRIIIVCFFLQILFHQCLKLYKLCKNNFFEPQCLCLTVSVSAPFCFGELLNAVSLSLGWFANLGLQFLLSTGDLLLLKHDLLRSLHNLNLHLLLLNTLLGLSHLIQITAIIKCSWKWLKGAVCTFFTFLKHKKYYNTFSDI